jgi:hypothetical protein
VPAEARPCRLLEGRGTPTSTVTPSACPVLHLLHAADQKGACINITQT